MSTHTSCTITPISEASVASGRACSGKCRGGSCQAAPRVWVLAACEGMISLFEKNVQGKLIPITQKEQAVFASLGHFQKSMDEADHSKAFDQLIIVGGSNDIAWIHASLPQSAMRHIVAEIEYPLLPTWFKQPLPLPKLTNALVSVFAI